MSVRDELKLTFDLAALRNEARSIKAPDQWHRAGILIDRCAAARTRERDLYTERFDARVEARRRQLVKEAGTLNRILKPRLAGNDRFDPDVTQRQAQHDVLSAHEARLMWIALIERRALDVLCARARQENPKENPVRVERSEMPERRSGHDRRRSRQRDR